MLELQAVERVGLAAREFRRAEMGSVNPPVNRDYGKKTRIDLKQPYQVAYWKQRFGISDQELVQAVLAVGSSARKVERYLGDRKDKAR